MVKCKICKKEIDKKNAFILNNGKYCCNENEYNNYNNENLLWNELYDYIKFNIFSYEKNMNLSTYLIKKLKELRVSYSYKIILETFEKYKDTIIYWIKSKKELDTEIRKISYMMAIINNNINDVYLKSKTNELIYKPEITIDEKNIDRIKANKPINKGISEYLEGDI